MTKNASPKSLNKKMPFIITGLILIFIIVFLVFGIQEIVAANSLSSVADENAINKLFGSSSTNQGMTFDKSITLPKLSYLFSLQAGVIGALFYHRVLKSLR